MKLKETPDPSIAKLTSDIATLEAALKRVTDSQNMTTDVKGVDALFDSVCDKLDLFQSKQEQELIETFKEEAASRRRGVEQKGLAWQKSIQKQGETLIQRLKDLHNVQMEELKTILESSKSASRTDTRKSSGEDGQLYFGFEKADGKRTWCESTDTANKSRLTRNGWNMVWDSSSQQAILEWVRGAKVSALAQDKVSDQQSVASKDAAGTHADEVPPTSHVKIRTMPKNTYATKQRFFDHRWKEYEKTLEEQHQRNLQDEFESVCGVETGNQPEQKEERWGEALRLKYCKDYIGRGSVRGKQKLTVDDFIAEGFDDPEKAYRMISPIHDNLMRNWETSNQYQNLIGPDHGKIIAKLDLFPKLTSTKQADVLAFYKQLPGLLLGFKISLMPFELVEVKHGYKGLCTPGVGQEKFGMMGAALEVILGHTIAPDCDPTRRISSLLSIERAKVPPCGYRVLWKLLEETVSCCKPNSLISSWPQYDDYESIFTYAEDFVTLMGMRRRKGERITEKTAAISFLDTVLNQGGERLHTATYLLKQEIEGITDDETLPDKFNISLMATKIADSIPQEHDRDLLHQRPRVSKTAAPVGKTHDMFSPIDTGDQRVGEMFDDLSIEERALITKSGHSKVNCLNVHIQGFTHRTQMCNAVYRPQSGRKTFQRPVPDANATRNNPNRRRFLFNPNLLCDACGRVGHDAAHCHSLAMGILLHKYMTDMSNKDIMKQASEAWQEKNQKAFDMKKDQRNTGRSPLEAVSNMVDNYCFDIDHIDQELDWHYFEPTGEEGPIPADE